MRLQKDLLLEYENILYQEETLWYQKSREQWIKLGSRNTSFFHAQSIIRRKRNKIHGIRLSSGEWCTDPYIMRSEALNFFKELFCTRQSVINSNNENSVPTLDEEAVAELSKPVTKKELRDRIGGSSQIRPTDRFDKYLGFKMFYGKVSKQDFSDIYDRVSSKLASWKSRLLNKPGRVVLANSVISSLPSYHMQINWLPQDIISSCSCMERRGYAFAVDVYD
ncbi:hypothetical protein QL285_032459 [Trifolium repens]|nr:hypothetical protein QL285_032459 [Trifolium repens]